MATTSWKNQGAAYGTKPPQKIHRSLLIAAVAHRMQENALGAIKFLAI